MTLNETADCESTLLISIIVWPAIGCHRIYDEIHVFGMLDLFTGIWDVLSNQEVVDFVRTRIAQRMEPEQVCKPGLSLLRLSITCEL